MDGAYLGFPFLMSPATAAEEQQPIWKFNRECFSPSLCISTTKEVWGFFSDTFLRIRLT